MGTLRNKLSQSAEAQVFSWIEVTERQEKRGILVVDWHSFCFPLGLVGRGIRETMAPRKQDAG